LLRGSRHYRLPRRRRSSADLEIPVTPRIVDSKVFLIDSASITTVLLISLFHAQRASAIEHSRRMAGKDQPVGEERACVSSRRERPVRRWIATQRMLRVQHALVMPSL